MRNSLIQDGLPPPTPPGALPEGRPTFLGGIAHDDLAAPLAGLLHRQRCTQTLLMLPETLAFPEAVLLHDFMCYRAPHVGEEGVARAGWGSGSVLFLVHWGRDSSFGRL